MPTAFVKRMINYSMKTLWHLCITTCGQVNGLQLEVGLHHTRHNRCCHRTSFTTVVGKRQNNNFRILEWRVCQGPRMCGPGAKLTAVRLAGDIVTIFGRARLSCDRDRNWIEIIENPVESPKWILRDGKARPG